MSDKLTDLTTTATAADADLLYIVDVDDPTDDPSGTSKAIAASDLLPAVPAVLDDLGDVDTTTTPPVLNDVLEYDGTNFVPAAPSGGGASAIDDLTDVDTTTVAPVVDDALVWDGTNWVPGEVAGGGGGGGGGLFLIEAIELSTEGEFDFTNIPPGYDRLVLKGYIDAPSDGAPLPYAYCYLNENTTASNYRCALHQVYNGANSTTEFNDPSVVYLGGTAAQSSSSLHLVMENYDGVDKKQYRVTSGSEYSAGNSVSSQFGLTCNELNPVTRLRITNPTVNGLVGKLFLYGEKGVASGGGGGGGGETTLVYTPVLIEEQVDPVSGFFEFNNIPQDFDYIELQIDGNTDFVGDIGVVYYEVNGDTTASNYRFQQYWASNGAGNTGQVSDNTLGYLGGTSNTGVGSIVARFGDYNKATYQSVSSQLHMIRSSTSCLTGHLSSVKHNAQAAITDLKIVTNGTNITGSCRLVGYKEQAIGGGGTPGPITTVTTTELGRASGSDVATLDVSGLDVSGYDRIYAVAAVRSHEADVASSLQMLVNNDTTESNYNFVFCAANSTDAFEADGPLPDIAYIPGASAAAGLYGQVTIRQENPNAGYVQTFEGDFAAPSPANLVNHYVGRSIMSHDSATAAVNQLTFRSDVGNISGRVIVYGVKEETLSAGGGGGTSTTIHTGTKVAGDDATVAQDFEFTGLDLTDYDKVEIITQLRTNQASNGEAILQFNGVTTGYTSTANYTQDSGSNGTQYAYPKVGWPCGTGNSADAFATSVITILNPGSSREKSATFLTDARIGTSELTVNGVIHSTVTDPITSIKILDNGGAARLTGSVVIVGYKDVTVGGGGGSAAIELLETLTPVAGEFDITVPSGYKRITVKGMIRSDLAGDIDTVSAFFNNDYTEANYYSQNSTGLGGTNNFSQASNARAGYICADGSPTDCYSAVTIEFEAPDSAYIKSGLGRYTMRRNASSVITGQTSVQHDTLTAAITRIQLRSTGAANLLGEVRVYGEL